nr:MAG: NinG protein [Bacteriophage sp.]
MMLRCYSELLQIPTFKERYEYLRLDGVVGEETFGFDRYLNQIFYNSQEWKDIRRKIIIRDNGCDLGLDGYEIRGKILIHHMNPIRQQDILLRTDLVLNPEYLIATTLSTHNAIHYGDEKLLLTVPNERRKNDTCPWRRKIMEGNKKPLMGVVVNCMNLNIRKDPTQASRSLGIIGSDTVVKVCDDESVSGFYKVKTGDGISGYCMSEFIKLC